MVSPWWIWPIGVLLIFAAGAAAVAVPKRRDRSLRRRTAWSAARSAIASAAISRDASPAAVTEAERLLHRAEALAVQGGGATVAGQAADCAEQADELWRAAARD
jgi:hypothetical protein